MIIYILLHVKIKYVYNLNSNDQDSKLYKAQQPYNHLDELSYSIMYHIQCCLDLHDTLIIHDTNIIYGKFYLL